MSNIPPIQLYAYAAAAGFQGGDLDNAVAIALAESGGDPSIVGDQTLAPTRGPSIGLMQINIGSAANPQFASVDLTDPQTNMNAAYAIYSAIGGFGTTRGWTTYTSGKYQQFLNQLVPTPSAPAAAPYAFVGPPAPAGTVSATPTAAAAVPLTIDASTGLPVDPTSDADVPFFSAPAAGSTYSLFSSATILPSTGIPDIFIVGGGLLAAWALFESFAD